MDIKARNKQVKAILSNRYGSKAVSVRNGRGTAWGWCEVSIDIPRPENCTHSEDNPSDPDYTFYCLPCKRAMQEASLEAEKLLEGVEFYKYPTDDERDGKELLIQVHIIK